MGVVGAIAGIGSALIGASSASSASKAQQRAAQADIAYQKETRDLIRKDLDPYRSAGTNALAAYNYEMGLGAQPTFGGMAPTVETFTEGGSGSGGGGATFGGVAFRNIPNDAPFPNPDKEWHTRANQEWARNRSQGTKAVTKYRVNGQVFNTLDEANAYAKANPTGGQAYGGFTKTPGYDYRLDQGQDAIQSSVAARGGLNSGAAMRALQENGQNFASNEYGGYLNRLAGLTDTGMSAAGMNATAAQNTAAGVSNALGGLGNAQAAGAIGIGNSLQNGISNVLGSWQYQRNMNQGGANGVAGQGLW